MYAVNQDIVVMEKGDHVITPEGYIFEFTTNTEVHKRNGRMSEGTHARDILDHEGDKSADYSFGYNWSGLSR